jgi:quercetin dioxygenase-like cupin family protein
MVFVAPGAVHGFANRGDRDVRFLAVVTPDLFGPVCFREIGTILDA